MSIGRLLAAGKSLVGVQSASSRYRMDKRTRLPKFGPAKNPFVPEQRRPAAPQPVPPKRPAPADASVVRATRPPAEPARPVATRLGQTVRRLRQWCLEATPLPRLAGPARSAIAPPSRFAGAPIQSELTLDEVKVVRNDLSDADLEIVPAKPVRCAEAAPRREENTWSRLIPGARRMLVGAGDD